MPDMISLMVPDDCIAEFLRSEGADRLAHGPRSNLFDHLLNTREVLRAWAQPAWLQDAGAIHSVYSTETYRRQLVQLGARSRVRDLAGEKAERLAWLFHVISRADLLRKFDSFRPVPAEGFAVETRADHEGRPADLSREEIFALVILIMANEAEQTQDAEGRPGLWLARLSDRARRLHEGPLPVPPVLNSCTERVDPASEQAAREFWRLGLDSLETEPDLSEVRFAAASRRCPWIAEPLIGAAFVAGCKGDGERSRGLARQGEALLRQWGAAWDKRAPFAAWLEAAQSIACGNWKCVASGGLVIAGRNLSAPELTASGPRSTPAADPAARRLEGYLSLLPANRDNPRMHLYPGLSSKPWYVASEFSVARALEENFEAIRDEALGIDRRAFHRETDSIRRDGSWDVFFLYELGLKREENCALCPVTTRIVEEQPTMRTLTGLIYFSRMSPGAHVRPHRGITNLRVRCHLGIRIPAGDCSMRVGTETRQWQQGRAIVFDDYYEHEVWNRTAEERIVLIVDLWHPELTPREIAVIEGMQRYAFHHARSLNAYWSGNAAARREIA
jgi:aspartate beta-hydroxylase